MSTVALGYYQPHLTAPRAQSYAFPPTPTVPALLFTTARKSLSVVVEAAAPATQIRWSVVLPPGAEPEDPNNPEGVDAYFDADSDKIYDYVEGVRTLFFDPDALYGEVTDHFAPYYLQPVRVPLSDFIAAPDRMNRAKAADNRAAFSAALEAAIAAEKPLRIDVDFLADRLFASPGMMIEPYGKTVYYTSTVLGSSGLFSQPSITTACNDICIWGAGKFTMHPDYLDEIDLDGGGKMFSFYGDRILLHGLAQAEGQGLEVDQWQRGDAFAPKGSRVVMRYCGMLRPPAGLDDSVGSGGIRLSVVDRFDVRNCFGFCNDDAFQAVTGGGDSPFGGSKYVTRGRFADNSLQSLKARNNVAGLQDRSGTGVFDAVVKWVKWARNTAPGRVRCFNHDSVGDEAGEAMRALLFEDLIASYVGGNKDDAILCRNTAEGWMNHVFFRRISCQNYGSKAILTRGGKMFDVKYYNIAAAKPEDDNDPPVIFEGPNNSGIADSSFVASDKGRLIRIDRDASDPTNNARFSGITVSDVREGQAVFEVTNSNNLTIGPDIVLSARPGEHGIVAVIGPNAIGTTVDGVDATGLNVNGEPVIDNGVGTIIGEIET